MDDITLQDVKTIYKTSVGSVPDNMLPQGRTPAGIHPTQSAVGQHALAQLWEGETAISCGQQQLSWIFVQHLTFM